MASLKDSLKVFTTGAEANFKLHGYLTPVFAGNFDGEIKIFSIKMENVEQKEEFAKQVSDWIANGHLTKGHLTEYVMVCEAWFAKVHNDDVNDVSDWLKKEGSLQNYPNRKEVAVVSYCSPKEEIEFTADIIRGIVPSLGNWETNQRKVDYKIENLTTRFQNLFLKGKSGQN